MAGLLETIARRLLGGNRKKKTGRRVSPIRVKPVEMPCVDESMDNLTMWNESEPDVMVEECVGDFAEEFGEEFPGEDVIILDQESIEYDDGFEVEKFGTVENADAMTDDYLLSQIDEFRAKAQQLQNLLLSKESKVAELQTIVDEREGKAKELEDILTERQKQADGVTAEMTRQIDSLIEKVTTKMEEISSNITSSVNGSLEASTSVVGRELESVGKSLENVTGEMVDSRQLSERQIAEISELKDLLANMPNLEEMKTEILEKIHAENVKCYRNTSDLFKGLEDKMDKMRGLEQKIEDLQKNSVILMVLHSISIVGLIVVALAAFGIF